MSPERVSVGEEGKGHIFHVDGSKTEVERLVPGIWRLRVLEAER